MIGRRVPTEGRFKFAETVGDITFWAMIVLAVIGLILIFSKFFKKINVDAHFVKLIIVLEFISKSALINVHMGHLLYRFVDRIFGYDLMIMSKVISEVGVRGRLGGKLDEYKVPVLLLNANLFAVIIYLLSSVVNMIAKLAIRTPKTAQRLMLKNAFQSVHFIIMGATILDLLFYSGLQINNGISIGGSGTISLVICFLCMILTVFDLYHLISPIFVAKVDRIKVRLKNGTEEYKRVVNVERDFGTDGLEETSKLRSSKLFKSINPLFIVRFVLSQLFLAFSQTKTKT
jgi:hypothetical protein